MSKKIAVAPPYWRISHSHPGAQARWFGIITQLLANGNKVAIYNKPLSPFLNNKRNLTTWWKCDILFFNAGSCHEE